MDPAAPPKPWWQSKTIVSAITTLVLVLISAALHLTPEQATAMEAPVRDAISALVDLAAAGSASLAILGRLQATRPIGGQPSTPQQ